jgi:hypothetical protein
MVDGKKGESARLAPSLGRLGASWARESLDCEQNTAVPVEHASETDIINFYIFQSFGASRLEAPFEPDTPNKGR